MGSLALAHGVMKDWRHIPAGRAMPRQKAAKKDLSIGVMNSLQH
jgi:hypothetical protein